MSQEIDIRVWEEKAWGREETAGRDKAWKPKFPAYLQPGPDSFGKLGVANYIQNFVFFQKPRVGFHVLIELAKSWAKEASGELSIADEQIAQRLRAVIGAKL